MFICWSAQAALYHYYGVPKYSLEKKMFGAFEHKVNNPLNPLFRGFDDVFFAPHSRHTGIKREDIVKVPDLTILSESDEAGVYAILAREVIQNMLPKHLTMNINAIKLKTYRLKYPKTIIRIIILIIHPSCVGVHMLICYSQTG